MLGIKNPANKIFATLFAVALLLTGCKPAGVRALLAGKQHLDDGKYAEAAQQFEIATAPGSPVATNASAWNYLGLAYHGAGQVTNAAHAYQRAILLDRDLLEARFNLGCLWLDNEKPEAAKTEFTAFTLRRSNAQEGWLKLGAAQLRLREATAAEKSFQEAQRINGQNPEAFNGLGLVQLQRGRPRDAIKFFNTALMKQPDYRPALQNLATVLSQSSADRPEALKRYREYLALKPKAENWDEVNAVAEALEQQLNPTPLLKPQPTNAIVRVNPPPVTNTIRQATSNVAKAQPPVPPKTNAPIQIVKPPERPLKTVSNTQTSAVPTQIVKLPAEPVIKTVPEPATNNGSKPAAATQIASNLNTSKPTTVQTNVADILKADAATTPGTRYKYLSPAKPAPGNRSAAERSFWQGQQAQRANRANEAALAYLQALETDPSYFEAYYNLALVAYNARSYRQSLAAWESALALQPDSADTRYNFALALKAANYPVDAANELERLLAANPKEARGHLVLGNLYAAQLGNASSARTHYQKVLELDPRHPQAAAIRDWIVMHPQ